MQPHNDNQLAKPKKKKMTHDPAENPPIQIIKKRYRQRPKKSIIRARKTTQEVNANLGEANGQNCQES